VWRADLGLAGHLGQYVAQGVDRVVAEAAAEAAFVGVVEAPRRGQGRPAAVGQPEQAGAGVGRVGVAFDVSAALHVVDDLARALLGDLQPLRETADRQRPVVQAPEHEAVRAALVVVPLGGRVLAELTDELLVRQHHKDADIRLA
jgi:hypothetical protein